MDFQFSELSFNAFHILIPFKAIGPNEKTLIHIGCFYNFGEYDMFLQLKACQNTCLKGGFIFAGMKVALR